MKNVLVIGASGFLGSHLVKCLHARGYNIRILARASSNLEAIDGIRYQKFIGDVCDKPSLVKAMTGCDWVFHSAVDTRAWLNNSAPLYRTNVSGVKNSIAAAAECNVQKFVLTSSLVTIGRSSDKPADEQCFPEENELFTEYMKTRVAAEKIVLEAYEKYGLATVACCVSNTYGEADIQPTPHGNLIKQVALGRAPVFLDAASECVGVKDAAEALVLAAEKGTPGERYIISQGYISNKKLFSLAAHYANRREPVIKIPTSLVFALTSCLTILSKGLRFETQLTNNSAKLMYNTWPLSHEKACKELGWQPKPFEQSIQEAVASYLEQ